MMTGVLIGQKVEYRGALNMGKRSNFKRNPRDFYKTPKKAVLPLIAHLESNLSFAEPCAGDGQLTNYLLELGDNINLYFESDICPQNKRIHKQDALQITTPLKTDYIITNPPWDRKILHPMIEHFRQLSPTWLLFDADWLFTKQSIPYKRYCSKVVPVGRVSWLGNGVSGKDNCAWYLFDRHEADTIIF